MNSVVESELLYFFMHHPELMPTGKTDIDMARRRLADFELMLTTAITTKYYITTTKVYDLVQVMQFPPSIVYELAARDYKFWIDRTASFSFASEELQHDLMQKIKRLIPALNSYGVYIYLAE